MTMMRRSVQFDESRNVAHEVNEEGSSEVRDVWLQPEDYASILQNYRVDASRMMDGKRFDEGSNEESGRGLEAFEPQYSERREKLMCEATATVIRVQVKQRLKKSSSLRGSFGGGLTGISLSGGTTDPAQKIADVYANKTEQCRTMARSRALSDEREAMTILGVPLSETSADPALCVKDDPSTATTVSSTSSGKSKSWRLSRRSSSLALRLRNVVRAFRRK